MLSYVFSRNSLQWTDSDPSGHAKSLPDKDKDVAKVGQVVLQPNAKPSDETDHRIAQVVHGASVVHGATRPPTGGDMISRPIGRGTHLEETSGNWDLDIEMEDDHNERVSFHQVLVLWDIVVWRTVEDRHARAMSGRTSPPPEREMEASPNTKRAAE
mmetsp:Transcript_25617/g.71630  ORF Transcript_25617/g.71630 Transcript_25617/m.71630 type:complete len:157 (+) Transcript_25617:1638-2108(+)